MRPDEPGAEPLPLGLRRPIGRLRRSVVPVGTLAARVSGFSRHVGAGLRTRPGRTLVPAGTTANVRVPEGAWALWRDAAAIDTPGGVADPALAAVAARYRARQQRRTPAPPPARGVPSVLRRKALSRSGPGTGPTALAGRLRPADTVVPRNEGHGAGVAAAAERRATTRPTAARPSAAPAAVTPSIARTAAGASGAATAVPPSGPAPTGAGAAAAAAFAARFAAAFSGDGAAVADDAGSPALPLGRTPGAPVGAREVGGSAPSAPPPAAPASTSPTVARTARRGPWTALAGLDAPAPRRGAAGSSADAGAPATPLRRAAADRAPDRRAEREPARRRDDRDPARDGEDAGRRSATARSATPRPSAARSSAARSTSSPAATSPAATPSAATPDAPAARRRPSTRPSPADPTVASVPATRRPARGRSGDAAPAPARATSPAGGDGPSGPARSARRAAEGGPAHARADGPGEPAGDRPFRSAVEARPAGPGPAPTALPWAIGPVTTLDHPPLAVLALGTAWTRGAVGLLEHPAARTVAAPDQAARGATPARAHRRVAPGARHPQAMRRAGRSAPLPRGVRTHPAGPAAIRGVDTVGVLRIVGGSSPSRPAPRPDTAHRSDPSSPAGRPAATPSAGAPLAAANEWAARLARAWGGGAEASPADPVVAASTAPVVTRDATAATADGRAPASSDRSPARLALRRVPAVVARVAAGLPRAAAHRGIVLAPSPLAPVAPVASVRPASVAPRAGAVAEPPLARTGAPSVATVSSTGAAGTRPVTARTATSSAGDSAPAGPAGTAAARRRGQRSATPSTARRSAPDRGAHAVEVPHAPEGVGASSSARDRHPAARVPSWRTVLRPATDADPAGDVRRSVRPLRAVAPGEPSPVVPPGAPTPGAVTRPPVATAAATPDPSRSPVGAGPNARAHGAGARRDATRRAPATRRGGPWIDAAAVTRRPARHAPAATMPAAGAVPVAGTSMAPVVPLATWRAARRPGDAATPTGRPARALRRVAVRRTTVVAPTAPVTALHRLPARPAGVDPATPPTTATAPAAEGSVRAADVLRPSIRRPATPRSARGRSPGTPAPAAPEREPRTTLLRRIPTARPAGRGASIGAPGRWTRDADGRALRPSARLVTGRPGDTHRHPSMAARRATPVPVEPASVPAIVARTVSGPFGAGAFAGRADGSAPGEAPAAVTREVAPTRSSTRRGDERHGATRVAGQDRWFPAAPSGGRRAASRSVAGRAPGRWFPAASADRRTSTPTTVPVPMATAPSLRRAADTPRPPAVARRPAHRRQAVAEHLAQVGTRRGRALPTSFVPLAQLLGDAPVQIVHDAEARAALRAAGRPAATVGSTILLDRAPSDEPVMVERVAHELVHASQRRPSPPRLFDDPWRDHEERRAHGIGRLARALGAEAVPSVLSPSGALPVRLTAAEPAAPAAALPPGAASADGPAAAAPTAAPARRAPAPARTTVRRAVAGRAAASTIHRTPAAAATATATVVAADGPAAPVVRRTATPTSSPTTVRRAVDGAADAPARESTTARADRVEELVALIEARVIAQLERRGGRHRGWI